MELERGSNKTRPATFQPQEYPVAQSWPQRRITQVITCKSLRLRLHRTVANLGSRYMYGGRGANNEYFDQVYVLSIPSFTWTKVYEGKSPRFAHTCHLVGNRQMLTVGGITDNALRTGPCDYQTKGVNIFDLSTLQFGSVYDAQAPPYVVPSPVLRKIGGT